MSDLFKMISVFIVVVILSTLTACATTPLDIPIHFSGAQLERAIAFSKAFREE